MDRKGQYFEHHRDAALALLTEIAALSWKEGGFLGHVVVSETLTERQFDWLEKLLRRHGLAPLGGEASHG